MATLPHQLEAAMHLFQDELIRHLSYLHEIPSLATVQNDEELEKIRKTIAHRFHTIKGGAGFFKLEAIRVAAEKGEHAFKKPLSPSEVQSLIHSELGELLKPLYEALVQLQEVTSSC